MRFLVVEDCEHHAELAQVCLLPLGKVDVVPRLRDAIIRLNRTHYDIVFLDLNLPDSAFKADTKKLLETSYPKTKILTWSGTDEADLRKSDSFEELIHAAKAHQKATT